MKKVKVFVEGKYVKTIRFYAKPMKVTTAPIMTPSQLLELIKFWNR